MDVPSVLGWLMVIGGSEGGVLDVYLVLWVPVV